MYIPCSFIERDGRYAKRFRLPHSFETQAIPEIPLKIRLKFSNKDVWVCFWASVGESWRMFALEEKLREPYHQLPI